MVNSRATFVPIIAAEVAVPMQHTLQHSASLTAPSSQSRVSGVAPRRFSRRFFGADPREVNQFIAATEEAVNDLVNVLEHERTALEARLRDATAAAETLRAERNAAEQCAAAYREQENMIARTLVTAQKTAEDLIRTAQADAEEIVGKAETIASDIVQVSCRNATEILQKAQQDADSIVGAARQKAADWLALLQAETGRLVIDAHHSFQQAHRSVEQEVASFTARLELGAVNRDAGLQDGAHEESLLLSNGLGPEAEPDAVGLMHQSVVPDGGTAALSAGVGAAASSESTMEPDSSLTRGAPVRLLDGIIVFALTSGAMSIFSLLRRLVAVVRA